MAKRIGEIRAVYDGKVLIPNQRLDIPAGTEVEIMLNSAVDKSKPIPGTANAVRKSFGIVDAPWFDPTTFDRAEIYP